jgi:outer membrane murein-binding lipoprotein Lpp
MTNTHPSPDFDLSQISTRNAHARHIVAGCASALPALAGMWQELDDALTDMATLAAQLTRLSADLDRTRLDAANLRAAMRAALAAHADGEADPLWYLRDELNAPHGRAGASRRPA